MQSIFRLPALPWSPGALDRATVFHQPIVDISTTSNKGKRKRAVDASPKPLNKKIKGAANDSLSVNTGGAVQGVSVRRVADGIQVMPSPAVSSPGLPSTGESRVVAPSKEHSNVAKNAPAILPAPPIAATIKASADNATRNSVAVLGKSTLPVKTATPMAVPTQPQQEYKSKQSISTAFKPAMKIDKDLLRAIVEAEINQAILLKHNELRLIDQEIAKCQVALEQIRRCDLIPAPTSQMPNLDISLHTGPTIAAPPGYSIPDSPAPWGVTDGPYTRHYATWLLPSSRCDPQSPDVIAATALNSPLPPRDGRVTRGSGFEVSTPVNSVPGRPARSAAGRIRSIHDPASPLAGRDPLILKRQKDGQWVKLYCTNCNPERSDFANVQGFLNHCRISHKLDFKSHEAAAIECGRPVEVNEYFPPMEPQSAREPTTRPPFSTSLTFTADKPNVHPLNRVNGRSRDTPIAQQTLPRSYSTNSTTQGVAPSATNVSPGFVPCKDAPFLSSLLGKRGFAGNISSMVTDAKRKVDLSEYDVESDPECDTDSKDSKGKKKHNASGHFKSKSAARPLAVGAHRLAPQTSSANTMRPTPLAPISHFKPSISSVASPADSSIMDVDMDLSPNTAESNPGLVSDRDDEDEEDMDAEEEQHESRKDSADPMIVALEDSDGEGVRQAHESQGFCSRR